MGGRCQSLISPAPQSTLMPARNAKKGSPARAGKAKPAKSMPRTKPVKRKAAPARKAPKPAARKAPARKAKPAKPVHDAAHDRHMDEVRRQVARRRPGMAPLSQHMHEQQDPSIVPPPPPPPAPADSLHQNWGDAKEKAVTRSDKPTNWFRQAAKPKSK